METHVIPIISIRLDLWNVIFLYSDYVAEKLKYVFSTSALTICSIKIFPEAALVERV